MPGNWRAIVVYRVGLCVKHEEMKSQSGELVVQPWAVHKKHVYRCIHGGLTGIVSLFVKEMRSCNTKYL